MSLLDVDCCLVSIGMLDFESSLMDTMYSQLVMLLCVDQETLTVSEWGTNANSLGACASLASLSARTWQRWRRSRKLTILLQFYWPQSCPKASGILEAQQRYMIDS